MRRRPLPLAPLAHPARLARAGAALAALAAGALAFADAPVLAPAYVSVREADVVTFHRGGDGDLRWIDAVGVAGEGAVSIPWFDVRADAVRVAVRLRGRTPASLDALVLVDATGGSAISLTRSVVAANLFSTYLSNFWGMATEAYSCERDPLPASYPTLRNALVQATLHERAGQALRATITAESTTSGEIVEMTSVPIVKLRQGLLDPFTNEFPVENSMRVEHGGEVGDGIVQFRVGVSFLPGIGVESDERLFVGALCGLSLDGCAGDVELVRYLPLEPVPQRLVVLKLSFVEVISV